MPREGIKALLPLFEALLESDFGVGLSEKDQNEVRKFLRAGERALVFDLNLSVELAPPGHVDLGWDTTFAHCPRCKVAAPGGGFGKISHSWWTCSMCGHESDPASTNTMQRMKNTERTALRTRLGDERFRSFAVGYVQKQGFSLEQAQHAVEVYMAPPDPALVEKRRMRREKNHQKQEWIRNVLFQGIGNLPEDDNNFTSPGHYQFRVPEVRVLLSRCVKYDALLVSITHVDPKNENLDGLHVSCLLFRSLERALEHLLSQGCQNLFRVRVTISDAAFDAYMKEQI